MFVYKKTEELEKMTAEQLDQYKTEMKAHEDTLLKTSISEEVKAQLEMAKADLQKAKDGIADEIAKQLLDATKMNSTLTNKEKYELKRIVEENHTQLVDAIKNKKSFEIEFKAAAMHMTNNGTVTNASGVDYPATDNFLVDNDIAVIRFPENFILNVIPNTQQDNVPAQRIRKEQAPTEGAVAVVAEGAVKPLVQYKFVRTTTDRVKYAGRIEWTEEFEMDFMSLFNEIVRLFEEDVIRDWQDGLLSQMTTNASPYVSSTLDGTLLAPDNGLAVVAGQSQLQSLNYNPDVVIMNPADIVSTLFQQDTQGNLKLSPYINVTAGTINGMRLISTNKQAQGTALIGESRLYREIHSGYKLRTGQYNAQLIENEYTAIGEVFSILQIAERDLVGWLELDLDAVKTALQSA